MDKYYINLLIIHGIAFKSEWPLELTEAVKLAREFRLRGYVFHIDEKIDGRYEHRDLSDLEKLLKKQGR